MYLAKARLGLGSMYAIQRTKTMQSRLKQAGAFNAWCWLLGDCSAKDKLCADTLCQPDATKQCLRTNPCECIVAMCSVRVVWRAHRCIGSGDLPWPPITAHSAPAQSGTKGSWPFVIRRGADLQEVEHSCRWRLPTGARHHIPFHRCHTSCYGAHHGPPPTFASSRPDLTPAAAPVGDTSRSFTVLFLCTYVW